MSAACASYFYCGHLLQLYAASLQAGSALSDHPRPPSSAVLVQPLRDVGKTTTYYAISYDRQSFWCLLRKQACRRVPCWGTLFKCIWVRTAAEVPLPELTTVQS